jgi:hypothetical protein
MGRPESPSSAPRRRRSMSPWNWVARYVNPRTSASLANSDGWSWKEPSWNQPCVPDCREPISRTATSRTMVAP